MLQTVCLDKSQQRAYAGVVSASCLSQKMADRTATRVQPPDRSGRPA
jgi:ribosomal protein L34E